MKIVMTLEGNISGMKGWDDFARRLTSLVDEGYTEIVLDLRNVSNISSLALGSIVASHKKMSTAGRRLVLTNLNEDMRKLASETRILDTLNIE